LKYDQTLIKAKAGEAVILKLVNVDAMPHNLVIVKPGSTQTVGDASFKMLNDPKAGEKDYVPDLPDVLHFVPVIDPNQQHSLHFSTPEEPGEYPFICTFPGHWMAMQGILKVE
jgi:azurin